MENIGICFNGVFFMGVTSLGVTKLNYHSHPFDLDLKLNCSPVHCVAYLNRPRGVVAASHLSKMVTR